MRWRFWWSRINCDPSFYFKTNWFIFVPELVKEGVFGGFNKIGKTIAFLDKQIFFTASIHIFKV